ncbi:methyltransferase domain-containing protein [Falsiruegeria mediterranea]
MLVFDEETTRVLDNAYRGREITARRLANLDALAPAPGDKILDLGCGNGLMTSELSRAVGPKGHVTGLDPSTDMRTSAAKHCAGQTNVTFVEGMADDMPFEDQSFDGAVSVQVFEYIPDIPAALAEVQRVLKPGGRLVIGDMHWDTLAWYSPHRERMQHVLGIWDGHLAHRETPAHLPQMMRDAGFTFDGVHQIPFWDTRLKPDGTTMMLLNLIEAFVGQTGALTEQEAHDWAQEQHDLATQGRFFFSISHFICIAHKP